VLMKWVIRSKFYLICTELFEKFYWQR